MKKALPFLLWWFLASGPGGHTIEIGQFIDFDICEKARVKIQRPFYVSECYWKSDRYRK